MGNDAKAAAFAGLVFASLCWGIGPIFIRMLYTVYDVYTMNLVRHGAAAVVLVPICLLYLREDFFRLFRAVRIAVPLTVLSIAMPYVWMQGAYGSTATVANLVTKLSVVFTIVLAYLAFHDERAVIRHPLFLGGTAFSLAGVVLVLTGEDALIGALAPMAGTYLIITAALSPVYNVWVRHLVVMSVHPIALYGAVALITTVGYAILAAVLGNPGVILEIDAETAIVTVISGWVPLALAHPAYYFAQKHLGASYCGAFVLFNPVLTYLLSFPMLPGENLTGAQLGGACVLMAGTFAVTVAHQRAMRRPSGGARVPAVDPQPQSEV